MDCFVLCFGKTREVCQGYGMVWYSMVLPSSFFSTRSTAPEQPPQVMVMLNL